MRRPGPSRQQGFGLLIVVSAIAIIAFTIVVGYSGMMTRKEANDLPVRHQKYLDEAVLALDKMWPQRAAVLDDPSAANTTTIQTVLDLAGIQPRGGMQTVLSNVLTVPAEGIAYRAVLFYYSTDSDDTNPPDVAGFVATGTFKSCSDSSAPCMERAFRVFQSIDTERALAKETEARLNRVAQKAQSYFKARMLQDPERNFSVNYFRKPLGGCQVVEQDLGCMDTYTPLTSLSGPSTYTRSQAAVALALTDEELYTAWGQPIEASNLQDSVTDNTPFSMSFRAPKQLGGYITLKALQQL